MASTDTFTPNGSANKVEDYTPRYYPWTFQGTNYIRGNCGHVYHVREDGSRGQWCGVYNADKDFIDKAVYHAIYETMSHE